MNNIRLGACDEQGPVFFVKGRQAGLHSRCRLQVKYVVFCLVYLYNYINNIMGLLHDEVV